jgi:hypothetical protein
MIDGSVTTVHLYRRELYRTKLLTREQEQVSIAQAKQGDTTAREELITTCLRYVLAIATYHKKFLFRDDVNDLVGIGNLAMMENVDKALTKENPIGYLQGCAKWAIISHVSHQPQSDLYTLEEKYHELQAPVPVKRPSYDWLYEAVEKLRPIQKELVYAHFGLGDRPAETLLALGKRYSPTGDDNYGYSAMNRALRTLRQLVQTTGRGETHENHPA